MSTPADPVVAAAEDLEWFTVEHVSAVGTVRRAAAALADRVGFGESRAAEVALVASEIATNQVKHAGGGAVLLRRRRTETEAAVELLAVDEGPGMRDVTAAMRDGTSSSGTLGIGLGTLPRLASAWDVHSAPGQGTVVAAAFGATPAPLPWVAGPTGVTRPMTGQTACGDAFAVRDDDGVLSVLVSDGLGHGPLAALASQEAVRTFLAAPAGPPARLLEAVHRALVGTRGAAVSVVQPVGGVLRYAGLGNIAGAQLGGDRPRGLVSHPGIAGSGSPTVRETTYPVEGGVVVLHSDGVTSRMQPDRYPGLLAHCPLVVAGVLLRDYGVRRDDACVVVLPLHGAGARGAR